MMEFKSINEAFDWMNDQVSVVSREGSDKMVCAFEYLGNPHKGLPIIHVTGTNGKGSTATFIRDLLLSQGLKVGTFTSPHIMRFNERIGYDGQQIEDKDLIKLLNIMYDLNEYMETTEYGRLAYFELYTVMMGLYFSWKKPDVCIIEVGIGGYSDATYVFDGDMAIITTIGLDHADKLGNTEAEIAYEKSGIIKQDAIVITGEISTESMQIIKKAVLEKGAELFQYGIDYKAKNIKNLKANGSQFDWHSHFDFQSIEISMIGSHQIENASVALQAFSQWMYNKTKQKIDWVKALEAIKLTKWLARMEKINDQPLIYIDGAHNVHGLLALKKMMTQYFDDYTYSIVYSGLSTKNQDEQLPIILSMEAEEIFLTEFEHDKSMTIEDFEAMDQVQKEKITYIDWQAFLGQYLHESKRENHILLITGSLYFVSDVRAFVLNSK